MNSSPFWEAFNFPEQLAARVAVPISALESVDMSPYQKDPAGFARDVLGIRVWDQTAQTLKAIASWNGKVRLLTPLEQYSAEKLWFRRWWERMGLPLWRGEVPRPCWVMATYSTSSGKFFHPPIPRGPGRSLLEWTIYSGWPGNSPQKKDPRRRAGRATRCGGTHRGGGFCAQPIGSSTTKVLPGWENQPAAHQPKQKEQAPTGSQVAHSLPFFPGSLLVKDVSNLFSGGRTSWSRG